MIKLEQLQTRLLLSPISELKPSNDIELTASAILMPIYPAPSGLQLIMIKRAAHLRHHPGQIAFPGGKQEFSDSSLMETALRESFEEIALCRSRISPLYRLPRIDTMTGFQITPFVGLLNKKPKLTANNNEVETVLHLPLNELMNEKNYGTSTHLLKGKAHKVVWIQLEECMIWGASAKILQQLIMRLR